MGSPTNFDGKNSTHFETISEDADSATLTGVADHARSFDEISHRSRNDARFTTVTVFAIDRNQVRIGISGPRSVDVLRKELIRGPLQLE